MRTKLLFLLFGIALAILLSKGFLTYVQSSCGQYRIFEPPCSKLLSEAETAEFLQDRQGAVEEITQINQGVVVFNDVVVRCPGKSMIVITHPSENDCGPLNEILNRYFSDIPYEIVNN